jgi:hypothetical protein
MVQLPIQLQGAYGEAIFEAIFDDNLSFSLVCEAAIEHLAKSVQKPNPVRAFNESTGFSIVSNKAVCLDFIEAV